MSHRPLLASVLGSVLSITAVSQQATNAQRYEIHGTVVDHLTNRPIGRALVRLTPTVGGGGQVTSLTGDDGRFGFSNIPKGKYHLGAQRRGQLPHAFHETGQYSTAVVVGPGLDTSNVIFPLQSTGSISGLVVDEDGEPLQLASVTVLREMVVDGEKRTVQIGNSQSNSLGRFRVGQLAAGTYYVAVQGVAFWGAGLPANIAPSEDVVYPPTFYGNTTDGQSAQAITLAEGATAEIELALHPVPNIHVPIPIPAGKTGPRVPQLLVRGPGGTLIQVNAMSSGRYDPQPESRMVLTGLAAGRYLAQSFSDGRAEQGVGAQEVELADGVPFPTPEHTRTTAISGRVTFEDGKRPAENGALIFFSPEQEHRFEIPLGSDGSFAKAVSGTFPGPYSVQLNNPDYYIESIAAKGTPVLGDRLELANASSLALSIVAASFAACKLDGFALRDGNPIAGAMVLLVPTDLNRGGFFRRDQSDSDGSFTLPGIVPGKYTLVAIDDDGRGLAYKDPAVIQPYLAAGQPVTLPLASPGTVKITVQPRLR